MWWRTTLRHVLTHRAGQPRFGPEAADLDLPDDSGLRASLAQAAPEYVPGASLGEHALTYGHLVDGILRAGAGATPPEPWTRSGPTPGPGGSRSSERSTCTRPRRQWLRSSPWTLGFVRDKGKIAKGGIGVTPGPPKSPQPWATT
ncbi:beta-lactamase family protein [Streptomyces sp. RTd22]|uniref:beta-lactamase family protein n=1 Tax=Streptomyces sp. RTd22 TaxID=1841249 RepID=UPI001F40960C|nr:beta-lactamase family protein [Streptomyces sp. RTd22]